MKNLGFLGYDKYAACSTGRIYSLRSGKYLREAATGSGYLSVTLAQDGKRTNVLVHRVVAMAYLGYNEDEKLQVNHVNGVKSDNHLYNLEWCTPQQNTRHAIDTGLKTKFNKEDRLLTDEEAHKICQLLEDNWRNCDIIDLMGVGNQVIANIRYGKDYTDISREYNVKGSIPSRRKISTEKLTRICEMLRDKIPYSDIVAEVGVSLATVSKVKNRVTGTYISNNFTF